MAFQIPVERAREAKFTPDGKEIIFTTYDLRFERWNIATQKAVEGREIVLRDDCGEQELSHDGKYLACLDESFSVSLIEIKTGKKVWEKKNVYYFTFLEYFKYIFTDREEDKDGVGFFRDPILAGFAISGL